MPLPLAPTNDAGGLLYMEYSDSGDGERHSIRLHVAHFNQVPTSGGDYTYDGTGLVVPTEVGVNATFAAFAALWATYYPPAWTLHPVAMWYNAAGTLTKLDAAPSAAPVAGANTFALASDIATRRIFHLSSNAGTRRRLWLSQLPDRVSNVTVTVTSTAGGLDARDVDLLAYLSGPATGFVAPDGQRFRPSARVRAWWARNLEAAPPPGTGGTDDIYLQPAAPASPTGVWLWVDTAGGTPPWPLYVWNEVAGAWQQVGTAGGSGGGTGLTGNCLIFPNAAQICNPSTDEVTMITPTGAYTFDPAGITLPGGSRLEVV